MRKITPDDIGLILGMLALLVFWYEFGVTELVHEILSDIGTGLIIYAMITKALRRGKS